VGTEKLSLAISPKLSLWNPYDRPMSLENLILEVPFRNGSFDVSHFNLKEYDLYRKWWIRLYNNVDEFPTKDTGSKNTKGTRALIKKPNTPWGLFKKVVDFELITAGDVTSFLVYSEPGILDAKKKSFPVADSEQGLQLTSLSNGTRVIAHENIRENVTYEGDFHFFSFADDFNIKVNLPKVYLRVEDTILEPGEIANFSIENLQSQDIPSDPQESPPIISVRKGDLEDFFLWESSFAYTSQQ